MTHCDGYRAAALSTTNLVSALGIDAEPKAPLPEDVSELVVHGAERPMLERLERDLPDLPWDRILFSAKESFYKAWYPRHARFLDFDEVAVTIGRGTFRAVLLADGLSHTGRWLASSDLIVTACVVPAGAGPSLSEVFSPR